MRRTAQQRKEAGQDAIISAIVAAAFKADDTGDGELGDAIRREGARLAKRFGIAQVPGLPGTYYQGCDLKLNADFEAAALAAFPMKNERTS